MLSSLEIEHHWVAEEVYSKRTVIPAGLKLTQHSHPYDHASALVSGSVLFEVDGDASVVTGPAMLMVLAGKQHSVTAITDSIWHCLWVCSDTNPDTVDKTILHED